MDHMQFLVGRSNEPDGDPCGHALMASCPPEPELEKHPEVPFGHDMTFVKGNGQQTWDLSKGDLANLLDLSKRINLDGEITPVSMYILGSFVIIDGSTRLVARRLSIYELVLTRI
jgi:hypothetical protein